MGTKEVVGSKIINHDYLCILHFKHVNIHYIITEVRNPLLWKGVLEYLNSNPNSYEYNIVRGVTVTTRTQLKTRLIS